MHFGLYLKNKGLISAEQLVAALEVQMRTMVPIGQLALEEGILSPRDIFMVLQAQSTSPRERFGELAIEMGLLTRDQLMRLLMLQSDRQQPISEILVKQGVLGQQQMTAELAEFRQFLQRPQRTVTRRIVPPPRAKKADLPPVEVIAAV
jgi:hypothetical protein